MKEKKNMLTVMVCLLLLIVNVYGEEKEILNVPAIFQKKKVIDGYDTTLLEYDFDKDGKKEKLIVSTKPDSRNTFFSIYTQKDRKYRLTVQILLKLGEDFSSLNGIEGRLDKIREYYSDYSKNMKENEVRYVKFDENNLKNKISIKLKFDKHTTKNTDTFLFVRESTGLKENPDINSGNAAELKFKDEPKVLFEFISDTDGKKESWFFVENEAGGQKTRGYINGTQPVLKRAFYWDRMYSIIDRFEKFFNNAYDKNDQIYIVKEYTPMSRDVSSEKDRYGNRRNQSITGYTSLDRKGETVNIPDRTMFRVVSENGNMLEIQTPNYERTYFIENNRENYEEWNFFSRVGKFIVIDTDSQTEAVIEKDGDRLNVITYSSVTTGKDDGFSSYETPKGMFLVDITKEYMAFGSRRDGEIRINGRAKGAIRFSGGGYLHGIPLNNGGTNRKAVEEKIGTYKESHKCVRHYDDQIDFIMKWVNGNSRMKEGDGTVPEKPVVVLVL